MSTVARRIIKGKEKCQVRVLIANPKEEKVLMAQTPEHMTGGMKTEVSKSFAGTETQGSMSVENNNAQPGWMKLLRIIYNVTLDAMTLYYDNLTAKDLHEEKGKLGACFFEKVWQLMWSGKDEDLMEVTPLRMIPGNVPSSPSMTRAEQEKEVVAEGLCSLEKNLPRMSPDTAQDIEEERSEEEDDTLVNLVKTKVRKKKDSESSEDDVPDISSNKRKAVKKSSNKVAAKHLDKWRFVTQRRVAVERELGKETVEVKEVMELIQAVGLMKIVTALPQCYEGLVKEFIVNIPDESYGKSSREVCKVVVRGKCVNLSPTIINRFLERGTDEGVDLEATDNEICRMITAGQINEWPSRKHLAASKLTVKYAFLHKIGSANWVPTNHISTISIALGRIIHAIGTRI
ncbi:uncharacterized protein LOC127130765 [Lathyrus oleraceus]|uniref:uncharacterized protein LOC127130765 n=1 Tax=Pisum sativum TaxID=3888 RepID=UPI0021CF4CE5|nr:uncharacterized protein LOC127130765 [Pisum sativum]